MYWDQDRSEFFRCFYECEIVPRHVGFNLIEHLSDDDGPTDDETIAAVQGVLRKTLEDAVLSYLPN
jgi:hypothetical protein